MRIDGESCFPDLIPGKKYLAQKTKTPQVGEFVVFLNPLNAQQILVKKVVRIENGLYYVKGNTSWATSSQNFGPVSSKDILGIIISPETHK